MLRPLIRFLENKQLTLGILNMDREIFSYGQCSIAECDKKIR